MTDESSTSIRIATWNMKQVAPRASVEDRWEWLATQVRPSVAVLTEAKVPEAGLPAGWTGVWTPGGIGPKRRWGTVIAARGAELREVVDVAPGGPPVDALWPGTVRVVEVFVEGQLWGTVIGIYALTVGRDGQSIGHGGFTASQILRHLTPLLRERRWQRLIVAGDFNILPTGMQRRFKGWGLTELSGHTAGQRPPLDDCTGCTGRESCGHLWTHRNGNGPGAAHQQIDFVFASHPILEDLTSYGGGVESFPDVWLKSDHAPLYADFAWPPSQLRRPSAAALEAPYEIGSSAASRPRTIIRRRRK